MHTVAPPKSLFKYTGAEFLLKSLQMDLWKFSLPTEFNDPFEAPFVFEGISSSAFFEVADKRAMEQIAQQRYDRLPEIAKKWLDFGLYTGYLRTQAAPYNLGYDKTERILRDVMEENLRKHASNFAILCTTERNDSLLMWAHYAQFHRGVAVEFNTTHSCFNNMDDKSSWIGQFGKVSYSSKRPKGFFVDLPFNDYLFTKSEEWKYENEWRIISRKSNATIEENGMVFFRIPIEAVNSIIFGLRSSSVVRDAVCHFIAEAEQARHIKCYMAKQHPEKHSLVFDRIPLERSSRSGAAGFVPTFYADSMPGDTMFYR